jgi:Transposase IS116/IS110/IS902 family
VWYLAHTPGGDQFVAYMESADFGRALSLFSASQDEFDLWFKHRLAGSTGLDLNTPPSGPLPQLLSSRIALRELGRRARFLDAQIGQLDELIIPLVAGGTPSLPGLHGVGPDTAALLLIAAGDHPQRLRSEAAWAHLCGAAPIPASSGKVTRWRLNRGGNREASHALWRIVITRMSSHPATRAYVTRRSKEGLSKKEIIRCLKRYVAREVYPCLRPAR